MNKQIDYNYPIKVWITTVLFATILFYLDLIYFSYPQEKGFIPEDAVIIGMIFFGLLTYSLPILLLIGAILFSTRKIIENQLALKALTILVGVSVTLIVLLYIGYGFSWVTASCLVIEIIAGMIFKISKNKKYSDPVHVQ
jgi:hypothetical protein